MNPLNRNQSAHNKNKRLFGLLIIVSGILFLLVKTGFITGVTISDIWPYILIGIGLIIGIKHRFTNVAPYILIGIGLFHAIPAFTFSVGERVIYSHSLAFPLIVIVVGLIILLRPSGQRCFRRQHAVVNNTDTVLDIDVIFGGRKEVITTKDLKGGRIAAIFGGAEVNMMQAESASGTIELEIQAIFGGCDLLIPSNWEIRNEIVPVFGGIEDNRVLRPTENEKNTLLIIKGSCVFGGVGIKTF